MHTAVDRRDPRLAAGFDLAVEPAHLADLVEQHLLCFFRVVALFFRHAGQHGFHHGQIRAA
jgi:hypothetical protein